MTVSIVERLDDFIEFATACKRFADVGFYNDVKAYIKQLEQRLEIDPAHSIDGIECRDETIKLLEARNAEMEGWEKACKNESASRSKLQKLAVDCGEKLSEADAEIFKLQEREWISVSERLPDNIMEPVLVKHLNTVPMVAYYSKRKQWNRTGRSDITNDSIPTPIAWQPLPPTEDKK